MLVTIHQPEHFPYMGFFEKMKESDLFILLDDVQYKKNNWQNRNKFLNKNGVEEFFGVQVESGSTKKLIKDVNVVDGQWRSKVVKKLKHNFNIDFTKIYSGNSLLEINLQTINWVRKKLNISTPMLYSSTLNINTKGTQRLVDICKKVNATEYLSGQGGKDYLDVSLFENEKIKIIYHKPNLKNYYSAIYNVKTI